jgi:uncharacterized RDD family membrane protein YckC
LKDATAARGQELLQGRYAGFFTRFVAFAIDVAAILFVFALVARVVEDLVPDLTGESFALRDDPVVSVIVLVVWSFVYCAYPLGTNGRTFGMAVMGLRAVRSGGAELDGRHAVLRVLVFPLSFITLGIGFLLILIRGDRRALQDLIADSAVVYSWRTRAKAAPVSPVSPVSAVSAVSPVSPVAPAGPTPVAGVGPRPYDPDP